MVERICQLKNELDGSIFLFGARQTGKSTILRQQFPKETYIDLLDTRLRQRFQRNPALLYDMLKDKPAGTLIIIDEIPEVPELLNEVHRLISEKSHTFILCGSSARKLKRKGHNTLGGRALPVYFFPLVSAEIPEFDIDRAVTFGMVPSHYFAKNPKRRLEAYINVYLKEEIKEEALVRNLGAFQRFLEVAAISDSEIVNNKNIAQKCGVSTTTVANYFDILEDTLIGYKLPAYTKTVQRRLIQAPKFYFFDVGIANHLLHRNELTRGTMEYGHAFEHLVVQELMAYMHYTHQEERLTYWRTYAGAEVDIVIGDARVAIEIKATEDVQPRHLKGLRSFGEEHPECRRIVVSLDIINRKIGEVENLYVEDFFKLLWTEGI